MRTDKLCTLFKTVQTEPTAEQIIYAIYSSAERDYSMKFKMVHNNLNVFDLEKSLAFYEEALGLTEVKRFGPEDGSFTIVYVANELAEHQLELTWLRDRTEPYNLGDNEIHIAFRTDDFEAAYAKHMEMGCICYDNPDMGLYFIADPDGYWLEIIPE